MEKHDAIEQIGKFTLRDEGMTIASGKIVKYKPAKVAEVVQIQEDKKEEQTGEQIEEQKVA